LSSPLDQLAVQRLVHDLRADIGDVEFGYRVQGFLAHVLLRLGAEVVEFNAQGHPDLVVDLDVRTLIEVEAAPALARSHTIKIEDIEAIHAAQTSGYLALLDCAIPVAWIMLAHEKLDRQGPGPISLVTLRAMSDTKLSRPCTEEFLKLIADNRHRLLNLTFHLMRERALRGQAL